MPQPKPETSAELVFPCKNQVQWLEAGLPCTCNDGAHSGIRALCRNGDQASVSNCRVVNFENLPAVLVAHWSRAMTGMRELRKPCSTLALRNVARCFTIPLEMRVWRPVPEVLQITWTHHPMALGHLRWVTRVLAQLRGKS